MSELLKLTDLSRIARARDCKVSKVKENSNSVSGEVVCKTSGRPHHPILFFDGTFTCDCEDFVMRHKFCKHLVALYLAASDQAKRKFVAKATSKSVLRIPLSVTKLNSLMGGGVPLNIVLTICGPSKAGKTWLASQLAFEVSSALQRPAIYIDTEGFFDAETESKFRMYLRRFSRANVIFTQMRDPRDLLDFLGVRVTEIRRGERVDALVTKFEPPALQYLREIGTRVLVIDSLSYVIKSVIPFALQNLAARANIVNAVYSQLDYLAASLPSLVIIVQHVSFNPTRQTWKLYGGPTMMYLTKYCLFVQKLDGRRRVRRLVWPGMPEAEVEVELRRDYGYV